MRALVSGQAGLAILLEKGEVRSVHVDAPEPVLRSETDIPYLLADASDVIEIPNTTAEKAVAALDLAWRQDRALHLVLILLGRDADDEARRMSAECLEEFLGDTRVLEFLCNRLYSAPLPVSADMVGALLRAEAAWAASRLTKFLEDLGELQPKIRQHRAEWDALRAELFGGPQAKLEFGYVAVTGGHFRKLAQSGAGRTNDVLFTCLSDPKFQRLAGHRDVLRTWIPPVPPERKPVQCSDEDAHDGRRRTSRRRTREVARPIRSQVVFENVNRQKDAIKQAISEGHPDRVAKYVDDLVNYQLRRSETVDMAKSLCDLAMHAKNAGDHKLQLELAIHATEILSTDGWSQAQLGDAYLCLGRYVEAFAAYRAAEAYGQEEIARNGRAEVLKALGRLDEALQEYEATARKSLHDVVARTGRAEVLKALGRLDEALSEYDTAARESPHDVVARTGRASVLVLLGRFQDALRLLPEQPPKTADDWIAFHIRGMIALRTGEVTSAIRIFELGLRESHPHDTRRYFRGALAAARLRRSEFSGAVEALADEPASACQVLRIHAFGGLGETGKAREALSRIETIRLPTLAALRDELAARYAPEHERLSLHSDDWVFDRECELMLMA
ncbi:MAG: tetratricopeptide repeat protein [Bryobacterales bacterium]|nr:tetratricopeptide repeat protein [Bryobacterales bacterium]